VRLNRIYFVSFSRDLPGGAVRHYQRHYHTAILLRDAAGSVWFYHTLPKGGSHRVDLIAKGGIEGIIRKLGRYKRVLTVEVEPSVGVTD
jgi:hypothetical protein